ncbi:MAG: response regulator [Methanosarcinales archaeon]|jgi:two-component system alkaline phosphatase synthesis response regulator PhoP|nr:response regulator [Methanosarcinales archaeon]
MNFDDIEKEIIKIIEKDPEMPPERIAVLLQINVEKVKQTIDTISDTREKIMIVDDELDSLLPLKRALEAENYQVIEASSGMEAIEKTRSDHPDIILLDLMMPGMDGFEVCNVLKADSLTQHIPIIMLTAKGEIDDKIEGIETGADDYVTKPFDLGELKARIKMILRRTGV